MEKRPGSKDKLTKIYYRERLQIGHSSGDAESNINGLRFMESRETLLLLGVSGVVIECTTVEQQLLQVDAVKLHGYCYGLCTHTNQLFSNMHKCYFFFLYSSHD